MVEILHTKDGGEKMFKDLLEGDGKSQSHET